MFDGENVYVSARVYDSAPESEWVANEMRRDTNQLRQNDTFTVFFDTFYDRRNGFNFYTNPLGARADQQFTNEGNPNSDWNPVWDVRTGRFDGGWTAEMEIPFKTLRYRGGGAQLWGVQMRRSVRRKNEWAYLSRLPISAGGGRGSAGIFRVSAAATLVGIEPPGCQSARGDQALRHRRCRHRPLRRPRPGERRQRGVRRRREAGPHREPDCRLHVQHGLRPGRGGRAAGQPDPLQPVLPEKRSFSSRGRASSGSRAAASAPAARASERCANAVPTAGGSGWRATRTMCRWWCRSTAARG